MVYFILGILILLFYLFMTPKSIRGTLDSVTMVVLIVSDYRSCLSSHFSDIPTTVRIFVGAFLAFVGYLALVDISKMTTKQKNKR